MAISPTSQHQVQFGFWRTSTISTPTYHPALSSDDVASPPHSHSPPPTLSLLPHELLKRHLLLLSPSSLPAPRSIPPIRKLPFIPWLNRLHILCTDSNPWSALLWFILIINAIPRDNGIELWLEFDATMDISFDASVWLAGAPFFAFFVRLRLGLRCWLWSFWCRFWWCWSCGGHWDD